MSKKFKKLTMLVLSLCCSVGLAACGGLLVDNRSCSQSSTNSEASVGGESTQNSGGNSSTVKRSYMVTFDANGGSTVDAQMVEEGALATMPTVPTKVGYTFEGWYVDGVEFDFTTTTITENVTLTAQWTANDDTFYNVEVYWETVDGPFIKLKQQDVGANVPLVRVGTTDSAVNLTEEANQVVATMPGFELDQTQSVLTGTINGDGSSVFKAYLSRKTYTLSFSGVAAESIPVKYGATVDFESLPAIPTQTDKVSVWKLDGTIVSADFEWTYTENKELTAIYMGVPRTVTFLADGAAFATETVENNTTVLKPATDPEKTGYTFEGWYIGETEFDFANAITEDTEIIANFTANTYTLLLDKQEGIGGDESVLVTYDATISTLPTLTKTGYDFVNWTIDGEAITNETVWKYTQDMTAVADWAIKTYNVTFKVDGLTIPGTIVEYNKTVVAPTVAGYDITWDFDFATPITGTTEISGTKAVKAIRLKDNSSVRYKDNSVPVEYNENGEFGLLTLKDTDFVSAIFNFDLTEADIDVFEDMGYTHLNFKVLCEPSYGGGGSNFVTVLSDKIKKNITIGTYTELSISLVDFEAWLIGNNNKVFVQWGYCYYNGMMSLKDMTLTSYSTVTYDYDGTQTTASIKNGETAKAGAPTVAGYDVHWKLNGESYDMTTPVTAPITLTATASENTLKTVKLADDAYVLAGNTQVTPTWNETSKFWGIGDKETQSSTGGYTLKMVAKLNITEADVDAFIAMGYTELKFSVMAVVNGTALDTTYNVMNGTKKIAAYTSWTDAMKEVTITMEELKAYVKSGSTNFFDAGYIYYSACLRVYEMTLVKAEA